VSRLQLAVTSLVSAVAFFWMALRAMNLELREKPPASRAGLSIEQRRQKVRTGMWIAVAGGCFAVLGALYFALISD
jgi:hypothetical protein